VEEPEQRLRKYGVAYPGRGDDEDFHDEAGLTTDGHR
jgi:hypothetical protein